jgi:hypothetical protein
MFPNNFSFRFTTHFPLFMIEIPSKVIIIKRQLLIVINLTEYLCFVNTMIGLIFYLVEKTLKTQFNFKIIEKYLHKCEVHFVFELRFHENDNTFLAKYLHFT